MIHRYLHEVLTAGVAAVENDITLLEDLFTRNYVIDAAEAAAIKTYFESKSINIVNGYPRHDTDFPAVAIVLANENETEHFLGDFGGQITDENDPLFGSDIDASIWEYIYHLLVITEHPDVTAYYYELIKNMLLGALKALTEKDCFGYQISGADLAPDPRYIPAHLFVRQLTFRCQSDFQRIDHASRLEKAFQVAGIHVDSAGSLSDVGDVKTLITPYAVGDDDG